MIGSTAAGELGRMASVRTTYPDRQSTSDTGSAGHRFVWVSLHDPSPQELAAAQAEFGLPASVVDDLRTRSKRPALEVQGELLLAVVKTASWAQPRSWSGSEKCSS